MYVLAFEDVVLPHFSVFCYNTLRKTRSLTNHKNSENRTRKFLPGTWPSRPVCLCIHYNLKDDCTVIKI